MCALFAAAATALSFIAMAGAAASSTANRSRQSAGPLCSCGRRSTGQWRAGCERPSSGWLGKQADCKQLASLKERRGLHLHTDRTHTYGWLQAHLHCTGTHQHVGQGLQVAGHLVSQLGRHGIAKLTQHWVQIQTCGEAALLHTWGATLSSGHSALQAAQHRACITWSQLMQSERCSSTQ